MAARRKKKTRTKKTSRARSLGRSTSYLQREFDRARRRIRKLRGRGTEAFDELWEEIDRICRHEPPLYHGGGYRSASEFIEAELPGETRRTAYRKVLVARSFTPEDEARHGLTFLEEIARYVRDVSGAADVPPAIDLDRLSLLVRTKSGRIRRKPARKVTIMEVRAARQLFSTRKPPAPTATEAVLLRVLRRRVALRDVRVDASRTHATFRDVPLDALSAFATALAKVRIEAARK